MQIKDFYRFQAVQIKLVGNQFLTPQLIDLLHQENNEILLNLRLYIELHIFISKHIKKL